MSSDLEIRPVADDQWETVAWLWQSFRNDLAHVIAQSVPGPDGRYKHDHLDRHPDSRAHAGYLAWAPHPRLEVPAPVGFALVDGLDGVCRSLSAFWIAPGVRGAGYGMRLARHAIEVHPGPWAIAFQHDNVGAGHFWRRVATAAFGAEGETWTEEQRPVPDHPDVPPDHWIQTLV